jgi:hypothetical protein
MVQDANSVLLIASRHLGIGERGGRPALRAQDRSSFPFFFPSGIAKIVRAIDTFIGVF